MQITASWRGLVAVAAVLIVASSCGSSAKKSSRSPSSSSTTTDSVTASGAGQGVATTDSADVYAHTGAGQLSAAVAGDSPRVYVPNSEANTVDVIDPATFKVIDHFAVGALPQHVTPSWDLKTLYVDNDAGNSLTPIDPRTGRPGAAIPVEDPYNLYFTPDGASAIVVAERLHRLDFRDPRTWALRASVAVPYAGVDHADFTADGTTMIASCEFSGWLVRVDVAAMKLTGALHVGGQPIDVKLSPDGSVFYVANQSRGGVSVIDAGTFRETRFIRTGAGAHGLYPSRDGSRLYVSNRAAGSVTVLDFHTGAVLATWRIGGSPDMGGVSAEGSQLWLSGRYNAAVYVIDTQTGRLIHTIAVGAGPHGLSVFPQPGRFSLGHTGVYR
jgi:YVTN family beta-propeller protein